MDGECHSELTFRLLTDSRVQRAPASTQLAFSGRWTERWLKRQVQSRPVQWSQTFLWQLVFYLPQIPILYFHHAVTKPPSEETRPEKMIRKILCLATMDANYKIALRCTEQPYGWSAFTHSLISSKSKRCHIKSAMGLWVNKQYTFID